VLVQWSKSHPIIKNKKSKVDESSTEIFDALNARISSGEGNQKE